VRHRPIVAGLKTWQAIWLRGRFARHFGKLPEELGNTLPNAPGLSGGIQIVRFGLVLSVLVLVLRRQPVLVLERGMLSELVVDHETFDVCAPWSANLPATGPIERTGDDLQNRIEYEYEYEVANRVRLGF